MVLTKFLYSQCMRIQASIVILVLLAPQMQAATLLVPPNAQEIVDVLGADSRGLHLHADALPDLFTLTASRLEEDPKVFVVEEPYKSGRWIGGKAVIEFARDLSYTQVSIYDKHGHRQRIYSVRSRLQEEDEKRVAMMLKAQHERAAGNPIDTESVEKAYTPVVVEAPIDQPRRRHPVKPPVQAAVPVPTPPPPPPPPVHVETPPPAPEPPAPPVQVIAKAPQKPVPIDKSVGEGAHYEWDEAKGAYVPVNIKVVAAAPTAAGPKVETTRAEVTPGKKGKNSAAQDVGPIDLHPAAASQGDWTALNNELDKGSAKPETAEKSSSDAVDALLADVSATKPGVESTPVAPPKSAVQKTSSSGKSTAKAKRGHADVQAPPEQVIVPSTEAYDLPAEEKKPASKSKPTKVSQENPIAAIDNAGTSNAMHAAPPAALPEPPHDKALEDAQAALQAKSVNDQKAAATAAAVGLDSDAWVPSKGSADTSEADIQAQIAKTRRNSKTPATASSDNTLQMAALNPGAVPNEANTWVPRRTTLPAPDADINDELSRLNKQKKMVTAPAVVKINRDINNPEEGVLPVNSFEKFSGPRFGRHREYERRIFFAKKNSSAMPAKDYDFYVDEVDRKKEIHNIYFYSHSDKGRPPRLVAVEKHEKVTFMSNYDVDKEDKGKVTKY